MADGHSGPERRDPGGRAARACVIDYQFESQRSDKRDWRSGGERGQHPDVRRTLRNSGETAFARHSPQGESRVGRNVKSVQLVRWTPEESEPYAAVALRGGPGKRSFTGVPQCSSYIRVLAPFTTASPISFIAALAFELVVN